MALEIEAKLRTDSHEDIRAALIDCGAKRLGTVLETNRIYDLPDHSLRRRGRALRLRTTRPIASSPQDDAPAADVADDVATLTAKGPATAGPLKSREEVEIIVEDAQTTHRLLVLAGFAEVFRFQKRRQSWRLDDCLVELDTLPLIGKFVEIEGPTVEAIANVQQRIGLGLARHIPTSYISLLQLHGQATGQPRQRVEFDDHS